MRKTKDFYRFSSLFLILSFLLLSLAVVPICNISTDNPSGLPFDLNSDMHTSLSLIVNNSTDFQEAQSSTYQYGFLQSVKPKLLSTFISISILLLSVGLLLIIHAFLNEYELFLKICSVRIVEYLHDKDGMI